MWLLYEQPDTKFEGVSMRFMDITKRVYDLPKLGVKVRVCLCACVRVIGVRVFVW